MKEKLPKIFLVLFLILIAVNIGFLDWWIINHRKEEPEKETPLRPSTSLGTMEGQAETCSEECRQLIDQKVSEAREKIPTQKPVKVVNQLPASNPVASTKVTYLPLIAEGTTTETNWTDIAASDFYFNLADYPGAKEVRFIASLQALHGSAKVEARLYDQTNKRGVDYSELETKNDAYTLIESSGIVIWRGNNKYSVQLRSANGTRVLLKEARLKVIF
ncbi:MAG: hypothetical protein BWY24_00413 [Microgenomates group bacterium ADurb.Bin219]|nr:MAG: hypothetical protein BWY24_00413 [Microgenomates group bacterium ADurb.Bin219]HNP89324.1 hypothetical protein [Candidatus Woesebacteria bacterium]